MLCVFRLKIGTHRVTGPLLLVEVCTKHTRSQIEKNLRFFRGRPAQVGGSIQISREPEDHLLTTLCFEASSPPDWLSWAANASTSRELVFAGLALLVHQYCVFAMESCSNITKKLHAPEVRHIPAALIKNSRHNLWDITFH